MRKNKVKNGVLICTIILTSIFPILLFWKRIQITKYSIPAICLFVFHLFYGLLAYCLRHKENYLRIRHVFFRHFFLNLIQPDRDETYTKEYMQQFYRMLVVYYAVTPMYIPCIFLTSTIAAMPIALIVFLLPQSLFILKEIRDVANDIKEATEKNNNRRKN